MKIYIYLIALLFVYDTVYAIPPDEEFGIVSDFPQPAPGSFSVVGTSTPEGRYIVWDGDRVFSQPTVGTGVLEEIASGFLGDPAFLALNPAGDIALLGQGFGDGVDANAYTLDLINPADFSPGDEIVVPSHFSGVFLNDNLVAFDRGDFGSPAEVVVLDLFSGARSGRGAVTVLAMPEPAARTTVITKPPGSFSASLAVNNGRLYVADAGNGVYRSFSVADVIDAFMTSTPLAWSSGTAIGTPFQYPLSGVAGFAPTGNLVIGGFGAIVEVDPASGAIVQTIDPAGTGPFYGLIYNAALDDLIAIEFPVVFGDPLTFHATTRGFAPQSPCGVFDDIDAQFAAFLTMFSPTSDDLDQDQIPDTAMLAMIELFSCRDDSDALVLSSNLAYDDNLEAFDLEASAASLAQFRELIAALMLMNQAMQDSLRTLLAANATPLTGTYAILTCTTDPLTAEMTCLPLFFENPVRGPRALPRAVDEPYSADGDPDGDGFSNLVEYMNVVAMGGDDLDFAIAAASASLDGTSGLRGGGSGGGCFIATAAYGTPLAGDIYILRDVRDTWLLPNAVGAALADLYYRLSPAAAAVVARNPALRGPVRVALVPVVHAAAWGPATWWAAAILVAGLTLVPAMVRRRRLRSRD